MKQLWWKVQRATKTKGFWVKASVVIVIIGAVVGLKLFKDSKDSSVAVSSGSGINKVWDADFKVADLAKMDKPVLIDFTAEWCQPCKQFNPLLEQTKKQLGDSVIIKIVDVDKNQEFAQQYPVRVIPTQILIDSSGNPYAPKVDESGTVVSGVTGIQSYSLKQSGENDLTIHEGAMAQEQLLAVLNEMGLKKD